MVQLVARRRGLGKTRQEMVRYTLRRVKILP